MKSRKEMIEYLREKDISFSPKANTKKYLAYMKTIRYLEGLKHLKK